MSGTSPSLSFMIRMQRVISALFTNRCHISVLVFLAAVFWRCSIANANGVVGAVTEVSGKASITRAGATLDMIVGTLVQLHDRLETGINARVVVVLNDQAKTKIDLPQQSKIEIDEMTIGSSGAPSSTSVTLVGGSMRSFVSSTFGHVFNYQTKTSNSIVAVRGTDFEVDYSQGRARPGFSGCGIYTDVRVFSGLVEVANLSQPANKVEVSGGFHTTVPCFAAPLPAGPLGLAAHPGAAGALTGAPPPACPICPPGRSP